MKFMESKSFIPHERPLNFIFKRYVGAPEHVSSDVLRSVVSLLYNGCVNLSLRFVKSKNILT